MTTTRRKSKKNTDLWEENYPTAVRATWWKVDPPLGGCFLRLVLPVQAFMFDSEKSAQDASCRGFFVDPPSRGNILKLWPNVMLAGVANGRRRPMVKYR